MLNVGMVDNLEFWYTFLEFRGPKHVFHSRVSRRHGRASVIIIYIYIFCINTSLCLLSFQGISLTDTHVQHLALLCRICGDKSKDHKRKVETNRFVSEIQQI